MSTSNVLGVPKNRIYYGRKSPKIEMYKAHSFIKQPDVENILFKLQIVSAMGKGYRLWHNWDIANYGSNDPMKRILNFDTVHIIYDAIDTNKSLCSKYIRTRPIGRMKDGQAFYEPWDSSFFDLTLHKYNNQNLDTTFVIGLQNRRTDPLIMADFSSYNQMYFSPSAEFEKSVIKGDSIYPYTTDTSLTRVWKDSTWWRNKYWKKLGCREITIPFNFKLQSDTNKYCLLHVKELFDTSSFAVSFRNVTNTKLIDTVIGQDSPLAINFQPGEGKFLEVDVIPPGKLKGKLDNINQNKMVSMPVYRNSILTDSIIHYAVYYNYDSTYQKNKVYLAISQPTNRNDMSANVAWRTPIVISDTAVLFTVFNPTKTVNMSSSTFYDSYHPSITVRKDSNNNHKVYIAYSLFYPVPYIGNCQAIYIMESVYNVNLSGLPVLSSTKVYNKEIGYVYTDGKDYGTPTVNSAKDVLFYAWTGLDTMLRSTLYYSYKTPYQNGINSTQKISNLNGMFSGCSVSLTFLHPSISTYSTTYTKNGFSNYATLVWEQSNCYYDSTIATSQICMTYLKYTSSPTTMFGYFLPSIYKDSRHKDLISFYSDSNIIKFNGIIDKYPSVYTNLSLNNYYVAHQKAFDYITFESSYIFGNAIKIIPILSYEDWDNNWDIGSQLSIIYWGHSPSLTLSQPSIKQPSSLATDIHWKPDSIARVNVNFKMSNSNSESYQFVINEGSKFGYDNETNNIYYSNNYVYSLALVAQNTNQNHLSASPNINMNPTVYKNRRIFETGSNYNTLLTSARYFYKQNANGLEVEGYFGYKTDTTKYYITNITKDNYDLDMKLPFTKEIDTIHGNRILYNNNDSIYSDWFNVSANTLLKFKLFGNGTINSQLSIERQDSVISYPINVSTINSDTLSRLVNIMLINGNNKNYRFLLRRTDTLGIYDEIMAINGIPSADTVNYKTNHSNTKIIDLSGNTTMTGGDQLILSVTPNPAENEVYAIAYIPSSHLIERQAGENKLLLSLYNSIGILIKEVNCVSGETVRFDLRELGNGNYFVKAREKAETFIEECKPVQKSLIIKK
ncbi:MAG: hypothetical protein NTW25_16200 [Candidatus Kapabacteria bacterium]|nr:hypothetical protein [Candidatus Kapabacteria bacterium]